MAVPWHALPAPEVFLQVRTDPERGLSESEAERRLEEVGPNQLAEAPRVAWWRLFAEQFEDFMVLVLIAATAISFLLGEVGDAVTILAIVALNACLGFVQEYRAERSVETLRALTAPTARVLREGRVATVAASALVPGDVLELEAGDRVAADARLVAATFLAVEEAALTGESAPVEKRAEALVPEAAAVGDRHNMVFMGTTIRRGRGRAVVVATGMRTEMGAIAHLMQEAGHDQTPLQRRLEHLGRVLVGFSVGIVAAVAITGVLRGEPLYQMFLTGVSLAVAAIPEGLPAIVTVALALGVQRMIRAHAIVRRLPAVETLGCTTVICSDKTGTLTMNRMTVTELWSGGTLWSLSEAPDASLRHDLGARETLQGGGLCNNAQWDPDTGEGEGDPTEVALIAAAYRALGPDWAGTSGRRTLEIPFESDRRRMAVAVEGPGGAATAWVKGALDAVLPQCRAILWQGREVPLDPERVKAVLAAQDGMALRALRVLAVARRALPSRMAPEDLEEQLVLCGLVGMIDPPRPEARRSVALAKRAGVRTVMITGDHPDTARAIARELGILEDGQDGQVVTGADLDQWSDTELVRRVRSVPVFARVAPPHKLRVVRALKVAGEVVAMTGDGVNDAPAVKEADIGVAMGRTGTDVTKEASAMILTDDNFATIVRAIQEGRAIYDNIRKFIRYLLSCNVGEVLVMFVAAFAGLPLPLLPIQILFVNLVTDGLPAMALGVDPPAPGVMDRPPRRPQESLFARGLGGKIAFRGALIGLSTVAVFVWALRGGQGLETARTMAMATLVLSQLFHVFDVRSEDRSFLEVGLFSNPWAVLAVLSSMAMLAAVIYLPGLAALFRTTPLSAAGWAVVVGASGFIQLGAALRQLAMGPRQRPVAAGRIG
ncbi:MAG: cation-translocating P-type ATPase [Firmicutes bacterium]|nr:cation-translocating P-type ATPase [Alicyclobacillaceae bacterium]MCL6496444.1 cation-translocating P-type ATPase [Bacillota bacterium]